MTSILKYINFLQVLTYLGFITAVFAYTPYCKRCNIALRCSDQEDVVWATDYRKCFIFRNGCHLASANCQRQNNCQKPLEDVTKQVCQNFCNQMCLQIYQPVCGIYNGKKQTFGNSCAMEGHICSTGETYSLHSEGECPADRPLEA